MAMQQPYQAYKQNSVNTASPAELTLMLYNGCLRFIKLAKLGIEANDIEQRHTNLLKAQNIVQELMVTLDMNVEISKNLLQMYDYLYHRLIEANTKNSVEILDEVEGFVLEFRDTWKEVMKLAKKPQMAESGQV
ncbi:flagellar export chaperone FliS [Robertmurraya andreesenii]|uniref:Flagellar secretion chaperone FliS n=1 Tax=Anoxybacillus andreesenii TaxID=1325932 RepID=A0ABT9V816_9BACL|nr:flagellar export chaperone FliS [Robertmurraya andreesenii]MDQ0157103.1 flagellar protein FliS [Robertmurraya andreesenii]